MLLFGMDIQSLRWGWSGVCLGRAGLGVWGGMGRFLLGNGPESGGRFDMGTQLRRRRWGV